MKESYKYILKGNVQGVFFRASAKKEAIKHGVSGIVRNLANGDLYIEAEADPLALNNFENFIKSGPEEASVESFQKEKIESKNYTSFEIIH